MTWGEPEDKVVRARDLATQQLWGVNREAAGLLAGTATFKVGVNDDHWVIVGHISPSAQTDETYKDFHLPDLHNLDESEISRQLKDWAVQLVRLGFSRREVEE